MELNGDGEWTTHTVAEAQGMRDRLDAAIDRSIAHETGRQSMLADIIVAIIKGDVAPEKTGSAREYADRLAKMFGGKP